MSTKIIGIIAATEEEIVRLFDMVEAPVEHSLADTTFVQGAIDGSPVVAVISGIGKVNAAMCTQLLISEFHCSHILNIGSAGSLDDSLVAGDIVLATDTLEHDFDVTGFGYKPGQIPQMSTSTFVADPTLLELAKQITSGNAVVGRMVSGDVFVASPARRATLVKLFEAIATDMESAAVGHVCYKNSVPFLAIRAISDSANEKASEHFTKNIAIIATTPCDIAAGVVRQLSL